MPIQHPTYALPLQSANTIATKQAHDAELNRVVTILVENDRDLNATFERAIVTGPIVGEWDAGTGAFPTLRPNGDQIRVGDTWRVTGNGTVDGQAFYSGDYLQAITAGGGVTFNGNWARAALGQIEADRIAAETAAAEAQAYAEMAEFTRVTVIASGDGTATPITLPISVDSALRVQVFVNMTRWVPGDDYTVSGYDLAPVSPLVWPEGDRNLLILIDRPFDSMAPTSDDVTHDGQPISQILDRIDAQNTFYLSDYLHPDDLARAEVGNTALQNETRVTAAVQAFHDAALGWMMGSNNRHVTLVYPNVVLAINDEMFSEAWAELLWTTGGSRANCRIVLQFNGVRFQTKNWVARAAVRTSGLYLERGITYPVPKVVFRYEAKGTGNPRIETQGRIYIFGSDNPDTDPIGLKFKSVNISQFDCFFFQGLRNTAFYHENIFNSTFYNWQISSCGYQPTEYGGNGFMSDTVRFQNVGRVITATEPVFDASHIGRRFMLVAAAAANGQGFQTHSGVIESVDSPTQITLTAATAPFRNVTDPVVASFEAIKATTTAGSNVVTLSAPITDNLAGRYVTLFGCGQNDIAYNGKYYGAMTVVVTAHSGDQITLAHPARLSRTGIPISFGTSMVITRGAENSVLVGSMAGRTDDCTYYDARIVNGSSPYDGASMMALIQHCSSTAFVGGTKFHGVSARKKNNFGANFANLGFDYATGVVLPESILTHGGYSASAAKIIMTGGFTGVTMECDEVAFPDTTETATVLCDPTQDQIGVTLHLGNIRTDGRVGNAIKARYGDYGNAGMIVAANSAARLQRGLDLPEDDDGEDTIVGTGTTPAIPDWPTDLHDVIATGDVFAPGYGSTLANSASRIAAGFWAPQDGAVYSIGGGLFEGAPGDTSVPGLPGLKGYGPYVTPEQYGAVGDGVADDTAALMAALRSKITVRGHNGKTYLVNDLDVRQDEWLDLNGATLKPYSSACNWVVRMRGNRARVFDGAIVDDARLTLKTATVTAGASAGGTVITVDNIGGIAERMLLLVRSNTLNAFTCQSVASISGNTITLAQGADADIPVGAKVYASYGLLSVYHNGNVNDVQISGLSITGGGIGILHKAWTSGKTISGAMHNNVYMNGQIIAGMAITGQSKDHNYTGLDISTNGGISQQFTVTGTTGQTSLDIVALGAELPLGQLWMSYEIDFLINGVAQDFNIAGPASGKYGMSTDGTVLSFPDLAGGEELKVNVRPSCAFGIYINSAGSDLSVVSGAHRFVRCLMLGQVIGVRADSTATSLGLLHWTQVQADSSRMRNWWFTNVGNVHGTHFFCGFAPEPLVIDLADTDRVQNFTHLHTRQESKLWFNQAWATAGKAITINASSAAAAVRDGLPKVSVGHWAGPTYSIHDPYNAVSLGGRALLKGTYTVTLSDGTNLSPTTATGRWTMVGPERVCVEFDALSGIDTTGMTGTSSMRIGLPFKALDFQTIGLIGLANMPSKQGSGTNLMARVGANQTYAQVQNYGEASGGTLTQRVDNFNGATIVNFSLTYNIAR